MHAHTHTLGGKIVGAAFVPFFFSLVGTEKWPIVTLRYLVLDRVGILILRLVASNPLSRFQQRETRFLVVERITGNEAWT